MVGGLRRVWWVGILRCLLFGLRVLGYGDSAFWSDFCGMGLVVGVFGLDGTFCVVDCVWILVGVIVLSLDFDLLG